MEYNYIILILLFISVICLLTRKNEYFTQKTNTNKKVCYEKNKLKYYKNEMNCNNNNNNLLDNQQINKRIYCRDLESADILLNNTNINCKNNSESKKELENLYKIASDCPLPTKKLCYDNFKY